VATHDQLWEICSISREEYKMLVEREAIGVNTYNADCSCGCKWFHPLEGERGQDWGVCSNPVSFRKGQLVFEHFGCSNYESDADDD